MAFTPTKSPLYGGSPLTIRLENDHQIDHALPFFVIFEGSRRRHAVSTRYSDTSGLFYADIPGHDHAEEVQVTLLQLCNETEEGLGTYSSLATGFLHYECDTTVYLAKFLTSSVYNDHALDNLELIKSDHFDLSNEVLSTLDMRLNLALRNSDLSSSWHLLGGDSLSDNVCEERETLLHFCARLGLIQVAHFLLEQPGSEDALHLANRHGELPCSIAQQNGFHELAEMLSGYNTQGLRRTPHPDVVDIDHGLMRILDDRNASITSFIDSPNLERSMENDIDFLRETEEMRRLQRGITQEHNYNSDWPEDMSGQLTGSVKSFPSSAAEQELEHSVQRLLRNQQLNGQTLQGILNDSQKTLLSGGLDDESSGQVFADDDAYPVLEQSLNGVRDLSESLFVMKEKSVKIKASQSSRKKQLTRFSSSCPSLFQNASARLSSLPESDDREYSLEHNNDGAVESPNQSGASGSSWHSERPTSFPESLAHHPDSNFDPRVHIRINGVTMDSSETQSRLDLPPALAKGRKSWDGPLQVDRSEVEGNKGDNLDGTQSNRVSWKSRSLTSLDDEDYMEDDDEDDDDEKLEFRFESSKHSLFETPGTRRPLLSNLSLTADPLTENDNVSPGSSPQNKEMPNGKMMSSRGLSPYNAKSLQDLASPEVGQDSINLSTSPTRHMFEDSNMTKSMSTPSIPHSVEGDHIKERREGKHRNEKERLIFPENYEEIQNDILSLENQNENLFRRQKEIEEEEEDIPGGGKKSDMTWKDFLSEEHSPNDSDEKSGKTGRKEEKRRKPSMFSRIQSSYRTKKSKGKDGKNKEGHNFVTVSFSNSSACDVCHKPMANKAALRCQSCLVNVHESGCKDQIICERRTTAKMVPKDHLSLISHGPIPSQMAWPEQSSNPQPPTGGQARPANPVKERRTSASAYPKAQVPPPLPITHRYSLPTASLFGSPPDSPLGVAQWSSQNSNRFSLYDKAISEEIECETASTLESSNMAETISESLESLDADGLVEMQTLEGEPDINLLAEEPEAWSITVDKRTLKKLSTKDIKRQDTIWELIQTEKQYVKRLRIMQRIFAQTMIHELNYSQEQVDRLFPRIDELVDLHFGFLKELLTLQNKTEDRYVDEIGPLLLSQFQDATAEKMKSVYGVFCSKHTEAMQLYKEFIKVDRKFQTFAKQCTNLGVCEKRDISDFILGVTVRLSKYPILLEAILKSTKDKKDRENLSQALQLSKHVVQHVDEKVAAYEKLVDIQSKMESRAVMYKGKKFKRQDLTSDGRELIHAGKLGWRAARGRVYDVLAVVLTDIIVLLQRSEQKFAFFMQDGKSCVIPLYRLLVREKNDQKDSVGIYVISQKSSTPEMYEFMCQSRAERQEWIRLLQDAIRKCPPEKEMERPVTHAQVPNDEDKKRQEQTANQIKEIIEQLHHQDSKIKECCDEKNRLIQQLMGFSGSDSDSRSNHHVQEVTNDTESMKIMQAALQEASRLTVMFNGSEHQLSRSVSSVGEHVSDSFVATIIPKRAETFSGFDSSFESQASDVAAMKGQQPPSQHGSQDDLSGPAGDASVEEATASGQDNSLLAKESSKTAESQPLRTSPPPPKQTVSALLRQAHISLDNSSTTGSVVEGSASAVPPSPVTFEHMTSVAHLLQYLNALMDITSKQNTKMECLQAELEEAKRQVSKLSDMPCRRTVYGHDQLEELRNLQENINRERQEWERTKGQDKAQLEKEWQKLGAERANLEKDKKELHSKRDDLKREKEALQKQIDMMREQAYHKSSNVLEQKPTHPDYSSHGNQGAKKLQSHDDGKKFVSHQRSASADLSFAADKEGENMHSRQVSEPHTGGGGGGGGGGIAGQHRHPRLSVGNLNQAKQTLPVHLLSARNEQRMGGHNVQHLPYKLAGSNSVATSDPSQHQQQPSVKSSPSFAHPSGRAGSTDIKRVQSMSASPRSAAGQKGSQKSGVPSPSSLSGLMKLADPKSRPPVGASSASGSSGNKGSSSAAKSKSSNKGGQSDGIIFF